MIVLKKEEILIVSLTKIPIVPVRDVRGCELEPIMEDELQKALWFPSAMFHGSLVIFSLVIDILPGPIIP